MAAEGNRRGSTSISHGLDARGMNLAALAPRVVCGETGLIPCKLTFPEYRMISPGLRISAS